MSRHRTAALVPTVAGVVWLGLAPPGPSQAPSPSVQAPPAGVAADPSRAELTILKALMANPITAPYRIVTSTRNGRVVLSGRVGTKAVHDAAVQTGIATGYPIQDDLVIDTAEVSRAAALAASPGWGPSHAWGIPPLGAGTVPFVYPPPLFGRLDDPFFGFEPPLVTYPPWSRAVAARAAAIVPTNSGPGLAPAAGANGLGAGSAPIQIPIGPNPGDGVIEMTLDQRGIATLRGTVPSFAERVAIGQQIAQTPGILEVINLLNVGPTAAASLSSATVAVPPSPKPPPAPAPAATAEKAPEPAVVTVDGEGGGLARRVSEALARRPALADHPIKVSEHDGIVTLAGRVPTIYEAMIAFRAAQQTPGVREVDDHLEFVVPDEEHVNPLRVKGRPMDIEPYLLAQIRRQVGDEVHVDQVRLHGDTLEVQGTLRHEADRPRLEAILRSMPVLRGFRLNPTFLPE